MMTKHFMQKNVCVKYWFVNKTFKDNKKRQYIKTGIFSETQVKLIKCYKRSNKQIELDGQKTKDTK